MEANLKNPRFLYAGFYSSLKIYVFVFFFPGKLFSDRILTINFELNISNYRSVEKFYSHKAFIII